MIYLRGITAVIVMIVLFCGTLAAENLIHVVQKGETVFSISRTYQVSQEELMRNNNITNASMLQAGMRLRIPARTGNSAAPSPSNTQSFIERVIIRGDTLFSIARTHEVTLQALLDINGFSSNHVIKTGDKIKIPVSQTARTAQSPAAPAQRNNNGSRTIDPSIRWPVIAREINYMSGKFNYVLVLGERSEPVRSLTHGTVRAAQPFQGYGRVAIVESAEGYFYIYGGCESLSVKEGDRITPGMELGRLSSSQNPQLFFMVTRNNVPIDPARAPRA
jgi:LysM repeat protein